jgi:hypothetical protein
LPDIGLIIVVPLFGQAIRSSPAVRSLFRARRLLQAKTRLSIILYDNSVGLEPKELNSHTFSYICRGSNGGTLAAYREALLSASHANASWIMLVDQDTACTSDFVDKAMQALEAVTEAVAFVPYMLADGKVISPSSIGWHGRLVPMRRGAPARPGCQLTAISSCAIIRTEVVRRSVEFEGYLWLDMLDHMIFENVHAHKGRIVLIDAENPHSLSLRNRSTLSPARLESIRLAEVAFYQRYRVGHQRVILGAAYLMSSILHWRKPEGKVYRAALKLLLGFR